MSLDLSKLENPGTKGGKTIARCPACAEAGADTKGDHLSIDSDGRFTCIMYPGPPGHAHRKRIFALVGNHDRPAKPFRAAQSVPRPVKSAKPPLRLPPMRKLTIDEMTAIQHQRGWTTFTGLQLLTQRGLLRFGEVWDNGKKWPAWIITDSTRRNAQARRLDGQPWQCGKAKTLPGSTAGWPIGASEIGDRPLVMLCEGQPDFAAALFVARYEGQAIPGFETDMVAPVCMCGASQSIHPNALPCFKGKHVRISIHNDKEGREAAQRWADQLYRAGAAKVDGFNFAGITRPDGQPVKDLADFAQTINPDPESDPDAPAPSPRPSWVATHVCEMAEVIALIEPKKKIAA